MPKKKAKAERQPYRARLPGFVNDKDIGLGDATSSTNAGIRPLVAANAGARSTAGSSSRASQVIKSENPC
jgi:hypothetical protein